MFIKLLVVLSFLSQVNSLTFGIYNDSKCNKHLFRGDVFLNRCSWKDNRSYSLLECNDTYALLNIYKMSPHMRCMGIPLGNITITKDCTQIETAYIKIIDRMTIADTLNQCKSSKNECY
jgi:hypothetical protein